MASKIKLTLEQKKAALLVRQREELAKLDAQLRAATLRDGLRQRKEDTRRKIIIGGLCQVHMQKNPSSDFAKKMTALIDEYVTGDRERLLFDLPPLPKQDIDDKRTQQKQNKADLKIA